MNIIQVKKQRSVERGVYVFKWPHEVGKRKWCVFAEGEFYPRTGLTRREAVNLAYAISISKTVEITITLG